MNAVPSKPDGSLQQSLSACFGVSAESLQVALLYRGDLADSTEVFLAATGGVRLGAVLWSPAAAPKAVAQSMAKAMAAANALDPSPASHVLLPLAQGSMEGRSYAILPYCKPLSSLRPLWWLQRRTARRFVTRWLQEVCRATASPASSTEAQASFEQPLARLAACEELGSRVREAAHSARRRLLSGAWQAHHVLMHADLWRGNVLVRAPSSSAGQGWDERLCLIDWGASAIRGYALFDLVRATDAFRIDPVSGGRELARHCEMLQCEPVDAPSHLAAALAHVFCHLGQFPLHRFAHMADDCFSTLDRLSAAAR